MQIFQGNYSHLIALASGFWKMFDRYTRNADGLAAARFRNRCRSGISEPSQIFRKPIQRMTGDIKSNALLFELQSVGFVPLFNMVSVTLLGRNIFCEGIEHA